MLINPPCLHLSNLAPPSSISLFQFNRNCLIQSRFVRNHRSKLSLSRNAGPNCGRLRCQISVSADAKFDDEDGFYIKKAVELAKKATGFTSPNPMVGCVIVKDGRIVGQGFHPKAGQPHAEVFALRDAGDLAEDATAYVSLEPCNHYGRTPPCTEAFIKAKVKRVVVGMVDPNPIVASKGVGKLQNAGIDVKVGVEEELCKRLNEAYIHKMVTGKPFVTLRYTMSVNGNLLTKPGEGAGECGGYFSKLLQEYDVVVLSANSLEDGTLFTSQEHGANQPLHILIGNDHDQFAQHPTQKHDCCNLIIFSDKESIKETAVGWKGIETVVLERICLDPIMEYCNQQGKCSLLLDWRCEYGDDEYHEFIKQCVENNLVQKVVVEILPLWNENRDESSRSGIDNLKGMQRLKKLTPLTSGPAVVLEGYF